MRKKTFLVLLALCMLLVSVCPVGALAEGDESRIVMRAPVAFSGGLVYHSSEQAYYMDAECSGVLEYKTLVVTLYKKVGSDWEYVDSAIKSGEENILEISEKVNKQLTSGNYKLVVSVTTPTHSASVPYLYTL